MDNDFNVKLCDFGISSSSHGSIADSRSGDGPYVAPEVYTHQSHEIDEKKVDVFALGVILFIMVLGKLPFVKANCESPEYSLIQNNQQH